MDSCHFILGANVTALENEIAELSGSRYAYGLNSGTDALILSLAALNIGPGDEVITAPFTFVATVEAICLVGATPVFADIDLSTFNLDADAARAKITPRTKAIMPVHLFGQTAEMTAFGSLSKETGIPIIADGAQAIGAGYGGKPIGPLASLTTLSFYPTKNLGAAGDAGMILTDDPDLGEQVRMLRFHGAGGGYIFKRVGYCTRLDELQAAFLRVKLPYLAEWNGVRRANATIYRKHLTGIPGLHPPTELPGSHHVYHQYSVRVTGGRRDSLKAYLDENGVTTYVYYPLALHLQEAYSFLGGKVGEYPLSEQATDEVLCLPVHQGLTEEQVLHVCTKIRDFFRI